jgi:hypothetical protein|nr:MAG TPA: zinc-ribbon containing domain protein [Caudoviricetes sp.]
MTREEELKELEYRKERKVRVFKHGCCGVFTALYKCPTCGERLNEFDMLDHCPHCGQKLDWSVLDD